MRKIISFMHISLDGYVAGPNGELNWAKVDGEIFEHVGRRIGKTDTALYGRKTYDMMEAYWPTAADKPDATQHDIDHSKWYKHASKIVLSRTMQGVDLPGTTIICDNLADSIRDIKQREGNEILLFGSPTATHALMKENLIDGFWLFVNPIVLGDGTPLFTHAAYKAKLRLVCNRQFASGVMELGYDVER